MGFPVGPFAMDGLLFQAEPTVLPWIVERISGMEGRSIATPECPASAIGMLGRDPTTGATRIVGGVAYAYWTDHADGGDCEISMAVEPWARITRRMWRHLYGHAFVTMNCRRISMQMLPMRAQLSRQAMHLLLQMAAFGAVPRPAFYDLVDFPALQALAQHWPAMRGDLDALSAPVMDVDRVGKAHAAVVAEVGQRVAAGETFGWVKGWGGEAGGANPDWTQYGLVLGDQAIPFAKAPRTLGLLSGLHGLKVAAFVRLAPGTLLPIHTHPEVAAEGLLQAHITLKAPAPTSSCLLNVAGEVRQHATGCALVFDGSLPHWALNASGDERVILYLEFHRAAFHRPRDAAGAPT